MITSKDNNLIKKIKSLSQKKYRDEYGLYIVEGIKMCEEAKKYAKIETLIVCPELFSEFDQSKYNGVKIEETNQRVFEYISETKTPQGIMALVNIESSKKIRDTVVFALDDIQDPGNLGTIIRTLDAFEYKDLIISQNTADPYNTKVVRSTMGGIFRLNISKVDDLKESLQEYKKNGYEIVITSLKADFNLDKHKFDKKQIIVIGNESNGVSKEIEKMADIRIKIPMPGKAESLNAAVATSIVAYERIRKQ